MLKLYKNPQLYTAKGDLSKQWFVFYSFVHPDTGKFVRKRVWQDINSYKTKAERTEYGNLMVIRIQKLLEKGYSPFVLATNQDPTVISRTLPQAITYFLAVKADSVRKKTHTGYKSMLGFFERFIERKGWTNRLLTSFTAQDVTAYLDDGRQTRHIGNATYNTELTALRSFFQFFKDRELLSINPALALKRIRSETTRHHAYSDEQVTTILQHLRAKKTDRADQLTVFIKTIYYGCLRPTNEAGQLRVKDVDFAAMSITIPGTTAKTGKTGTVELSEGLAEVLRPLLTDATGNALPGDYFVFGNQAKGANRCDPRPGKKRAGYNYFSRFYRQVMRELKLPDDYTVYGWKHTRNIHLYKDGVDVYRIMRHNRHTSLEMTQKYLRDLGLHLDTKLGDSRRL